VILQSGKAFGFVDVVSDGTTRWLWWRWRGDTEGYIQHNTGYL